jgi:hypothetical protein
MCKVVHHNKYHYDVYIGRPSKWGNPYTHHADKDTLAEHIVSTRKEAIEKYREYILFGEGKHLLTDLHELKGRVLGCWCKPKSCHGDILSELVQKYVPDTNEFF